MDHSQWDSFFDDEAEGEEVVEEEVIDGQARNELDTMVPVVSILILQRIAGVLITYP